MSNSKKNYYEKKEDRIIYVMLSFEHKIFIINDCLKSSFEETYRHNLKGRRKTSKEFIDVISPARPCVFILENLNITKSEAYDYILVWIKIFSENGYISYNNNNQKENSNELFFYNKKLYKKRKLKNLEEVLSCKNCAMPTYKKVTCEKYPIVEPVKSIEDKKENTKNFSPKRENEIRLMVSKTEYETIKHNAKKLKMQVAPYVRKAAKNPTIKVFNYEVIENHTREIGKIRNSINRLIFSIEASNNYLPREIDSIVEMMNEIFKTENKLLQTLHREQIQDYEKDRAAEKTLTTENRNLKDENDKLKTQIAQLQKLVECETKKT